MKKIETGRIADMRNLGAGSEKNLAKAGIDTPEALREMGAVGAYHALKFLLGRR